jgi:signal transduction histidine kinase
MSDHTQTSQSSIQVLLSKMSRYEALFELASVINAAGEIESVGDALARRLKYIADVYSWRYICFDGDPEDAEGRETTAIVVDGYRGHTDVTLTTPATLSRSEVELWHDRKPHILCGESMNDVLEQLPDHLQIDDLEQVSVNVLVENGRTQALCLFLKRRQPFTELDIKCLAMVCSFFHRKVHMLWEHQKLRDLELAYLQQEAMLRQSERLATLGRLSAGMAHELNNPVAVVRHGSEQLRTSIAWLEQVQFALGEAGLSSEQRDLLAKLEGEAGRRTKTSNALDPIVRSDLEQEIGDWLDQNGVRESWRHASILVAMGLRAADLEDLTENLDDTVTPKVIDYLGSKFTAKSLLDEIDDESRRIGEIVKALKGYSFMDQAPIQSVDVREGLNDTLVMLNSKLRTGVKVDLDFAEGLPRIDGYGSELNQVWTNLIDNAVSAMGSEGALELRAYQDGNWVLVEVADSGPGIPADDQEKIFDPFFTTKAPGEGTGLGLNTSHGIIVEKHGGQISVNSKPGATRFTVKLPISDPLGRSALTVDGGGRET